MTDDEFIKRECEGIDIDPVMVELRKALDLEEKLHPDEDPITRSRRLMLESLPAVYFSIIELAINAEDFDIRQDSRHFLHELHKTYDNPRK